MGDAIGSTLGYAVGVAASPFPIAAVILMLFSGRARANSLSFMVAWVVGIAAATSVFLVVPGLESDDAEPSTTTGWLKLGLGVLLLVAALRQWRSRPGPDDEPTTPGWMARIDDLGTAAAFGMGFLLSALNPKNLILAGAAGASIAALPLSSGETVGSVAVFTALAASTVIVPVVGFLVAGERLEPTLDRTKAWLIRNNGAVMAVLFVVFAASLIGDAVEILT